MRVGKVVNGEFKKGWLYQDQINPAAEIDSAGNVIARFIYGTKAHVPDYMVKNDTLYRFITDHLGSVRLVINAETGTIAQKLVYDEFGNVLLNTNPGFQPFAYAGGLYDSQTKLVRFGARDYDAVTGRWTAKDPVGFGGGDANIYVYCSNGPINNTDPKGLLFWGLLDLGEQWGQEAAEYYARILADPCSSGLAKAGAWAGGLFASLWTPDTSDKTFWTLVAGYTWRVIGPYSTKGLPPYLQRIRRFIRFDRPHHGKPGYHWDGDWIRGR